MLTTITHILLLSHTNSHVVMSSQKFSISPKRPINFYDNNIHNTRSLLAYNFGSKWKPSFWEAQLNEYYITPDQRKKKLGDLFNFKLDIKYKLHWPRWKKRKNKTISQTHARTHALNFVCIFIFIWIILFPFNFFRCEFNFFRSHIVWSSLIVISFHCNF